MFIGEIKIYSFIHNVLYSNILIMAAVVTVTILKILALHCTLPPRHASIEEDAPVKLVSLHGDLAFSGFHLLEPFSFASIT